VGENCGLEKGRVEKTGQTLCLKTLDLIRMRELKELNWV
jgi:hypothetical protein